MRYRSIKLVHRPTNSVSYTTYHIPFGIIGDGLFERQDVVEELARYNDRDPRDYSVIEPNKLFTLEEQELDKDDLLTMLDNLLEEYNIPERMATTITKGLELLSDNDALAYYLAAQHDLDLKA